MNEKYYLIDLDEDISEYSIFEDKFLMANQYTPWESEIAFTFVDGIYFEKQIKEQVSFLSESVPYVGYCLRSRICYCANNYEKDGFGYDKENQRVIYGNTSIYATLQDGKYVDVVTGRVIPMNIIKSTREVIYANDLSAMVEELTLISEHVDLYSKLLDDLINMFSFADNNKKAAQASYDELCQKKYEEFCASQSEQRDEIAKILVNIRKSSF